MRRTPRQAIAFFVACAAKQVGARDVFAYNATDRIEDVITTVVSGPRWDVANNCEYIAEAVCTK